MSSSNTGKQGAVLIFVLFLMTALSLSVGSLLPVTVSVLRHTDAAEHRVRAKMNAESGIEIALSIIQQKLPEQHTVTVDIEKGRAVISITRKGDAFFVTSEGVSGDMHFILKRKFSR